VLVSSALTPKQRTAVSQTLDQVRAIAEGAGFQFAISETGPP